MKTHITLEYERKFLIGGNIPRSLDNFPYQKIKQRYICGPDKQQKRVRKIIDQDGNILYKLTYKRRSKKLPGKIEIEEELTYKQYEWLKKYKIPSILGSISKTRYYIPYHDWTIELDVFDESCDHIKIAEVEFHSLEHAWMFIPPDRFGPELTGKLTNKDLYQQWVEYLQTVIKKQWINSKSTAPKPHYLVTKRSKRISKTKSKLHRLEINIMDEG